MSKSFKELLNMYWLRPETALWRELDIKSMRNFEFISPSLDFGCGDGMFSFIRAGGEVRKDFDAFFSVTKLDEFFDNVDVYDSYKKIDFMATTKPANYKIDVAFDHKENLLKKAMQLDFYNEYKVGDANSALTFPNESFNTIFSNIVYWLDDPEFVLQEIQRILRPGGKVCLMLPNMTFPEFSFYNQLYVKTRNEKWKFLELLDRGRFKDNIRQAKSNLEWENIFKGAGLKVVGHQTHLSKTLMQVWDIGLRPIFPILKKMTDQLSTDNRADIKKEWVDTLSQFLTPLIDMDEELNQGVEPAFHCYILKKP